jgi:hypothetical protein
METESLRVSKILIVGWIGVNCFTETKSATGSEMISGEEKHQEKELNKKAEETTASMNQQTGKEAANDNAKERHLTADQDGMPSKGNLPDFRLAIHFTFSETNETPKRSSSTQQKSTEQEQQKEPEADVPTSMEEEAEEEEQQLDEATTTEPPSKTINNSMNMDDESTTKMPPPLAKKLPNWQIPASQAVGTSGIGIGLLVEGIEHSDFGLSRLDSDYQRSRPALGKCLPHILIYGVPVHKIIIRPLLRLPHLRGLLLPVHAANLLQEPAHSGQLRA